MTRRRRREENLRRLWLGIGIKSIYTLLIRSSKDKFDKFKYLLKALFII